MHTGMLIQAQGLYKSFNKHLVVDDLSLEVAPGEVLGFLGPNGAGKSTTMRMLTGYLSSTSGSVHIAGFSMNDNPLKAKDHIGYLPEGSPLYGDMSAAQFLRFVGQMRNMEKSRFTHRFDWVVEALELAGVLHQALDTLSKGFKRRVGLAQALLHDPQVLILDEPTDGLDPVQKNEVRSLIRRLSGDKAIIISTHILEEVAPLCTRVAVIASGRKRFDGLPSELAAMARDHNHIRLRVASTSHLQSKEIVRVMHSIEGLQSAEVIQAYVGENKDEFVVVIQSKDSLNISRAVSSVCHANNWQICQLSLEQGQIDQVFRKLVTDQGESLNPLTSAGGHESKKEQTTRSAV